MIRYYVTDRRQGDILTFAARAVHDGVDMIQVREKSLPSSELFDLVCRIRDIAAGTKTQVLVNDRLDVALAANISGVHLPASGLPPDRVRSLIKLLGVSVHTLQEAVIAEQAAADFVVFGPVFDTPGKSAVGLERLREVVAGVKIPVLAIGGVSAHNIEDVLKTGAGGFAAIRTFQL